MTPYEKVREFARAMGQPLDQPWPTDLEDGEGVGLYRLRMNLVEEEFKELEDGEDPEHVLKELCDLLYVVYGFAATYGWDIDEAFNRVHESNMSKLGPDGYPIYREDGKIMKGPNYKEPYLGDLVGKQAGKKYYFIDNYDVGYWDVFFGCPGSPFNDFVGSFTSKKEAEEYAEKKNNEASQ